MRLVQHAIYALMLMLLPGLVDASAALAAGPWKAQVVDAETGQPLEGVVVLMYWITYTGGPAGWAGGEFYDAEEVLTDASGRFEVPSRWVFTLNPFKKVSREMIIFKPGYGQLRFRGSAEWDKLLPEQAKARREQALKDFEGDGVVMELPPLKTREERLRFYRQFGGTPPRVPPEYTKRLRAAEEAERAYFGFPSTLGGKP